MTQPRIMDEAKRKAIVSETLFYITAALVTFLALVISFKWIYRKTLLGGNKANVCPVHPTGSHRKSATKDQSQQASSGSGDGDRHMGEDSIPEEGEDGDDDDDIRDLLVSHEDIKPVGDVSTEGETGMRTGTEEEESIEKKTQHLAGPQKTKKLVEEVAKMMSDEQKAEERRIQSEQLEAIFKLVQNQQDTFGIDSLQDIQDQFKLYA